MADTPLFPRPSTGLLVAFEGIDGTGKSTQARLLHEWLLGQGIAAHRFAEPSKGPIGLEIRRLARAGRMSPQREFELFLEDRREDVRDNILPALRAGDVVLMDRYYISSMAYQGALGLEPREIQRANEAIAPRPHLVFLFTLPVESAQARLAAREEHGPNLFERHDYQEAVRRIFDSLDWPEIHRVDASQPVDAIQTELRAKLGPMLPR